VTRRERVRAQAEADVAEFNENVPVGSSVVYWKGVRAGAGEAGKTTHPAFVLATNIAVVWIDTHHACVALTHVTPVGGLHEQAYRNQCYHSMAVARQAALNAARDGVPTREPYWCSCGFVHVRVVLTECGAPDPFGDPRKRCRLPKGHAGLHLDPDFPCDGEL